MIYIVNEDRELPHLGVTLHAGDIIQDGDCEPDLINWMLNYGIISAPDVEPPTGKRSKK